MSRSYAIERARMDARDIAALERWYAARGSREVRGDFGQPLPALPISGHNRCRVAGCIGYTRNGTVCVDHFPASVG